IASRLTDKSHIGAFARFACDGIAVEEAMHEGFLRRYGVRSAVKSPSCELYTSILKAHSYSPVEVELAAVLPCFKVYLEVGKNIAARACAGNPYAEWIATYADPGFEASTVKALAIADELAALAGDDTRRAMTEAFVQCTRMEWLFWQSAYELEQWRI
ncbi:MAG: TenA family protein, partial [Muribaculaceae bacterium]|nr:TenA family protein [Muribaculaceae bacterium]